jgi:hypothetical protein
MFLVLGGILIQSPFWRCIVLAIILGDILIQPLFPTFDDDGSGDYDDDNDRSKVRLRLVLQPKMGQLYQLPKIRDCRVKNLHEKLA